MNYLFKKEPAFFPFVSAEVFFEAEAESQDINSLEFNLDAELNDLLGLNMSVKTKNELNAVPAVSTQAKVIK